MDDGRALCLAERMSAGCVGLWGERGLMLWRAGPRQSEASSYKPLIWYIYYIPHIMSPSPLRRSRARAPAEFEPLQISCLMMESLLQHPRLISGWIQERAFYGIYWRVKRDSRIHSLFELSRSTDLGRSVIFALARLDFG